MYDRRIYWDSCAFIYLLKQDPRHYAALAHMVAGAREKTIKIVTSAVTVAEVYKLKEFGALPLEQSEKILASFANEYIELWQADRLVCTEAHHMMRILSEILPMDAIHLATASMAKVDVVITTDCKKYRRCGLLRHDGTVGDPPLRIKLPGEELELPLFKVSNENQQKETRPQGEASQG
jgi:predicted nucleic acid-binding protein